MKYINLILITCLIIFEPKISPAFEMDFGSFQLSSGTHPNFNHPSECILRKGVVKCTGTKDLENVPPLKNPIQVSSGDERACAIDDNGVKCWGEQWPLTTPALKNPIQVSVGGKRACAVDDEGVICWGPYHSDVRILGLKNPRQISMSHYEWQQFACAIDEEGVKVWQFHTNASGSYKLPEQLKEEYHYLPDFKFKNPVQISCSTEFACVLHDDGVECFGLGGGYDPKPPELKNPVQISVDTRYACAIDDNGVKCWGNVPKKIELFILNKNILDSLPVAKSRFFDQIFSDLGYFSLNVYNIKWGNSGNMLLTSMIAPMILQMSSDYFLIEAIPKFKAWMDDVGSEKYQSLSDGIVQRKIALTVIQAALNVSLSFLSGKQIDRTQDALRKVGQAMIDPMNNQNILEALKSVESLKEERAILLSSEKSKFLIDCQQVAIDWLKLKVK